MNKKIVRHVTSLLAALVMAFGFAISGSAAQKSAAQPGSEFFIVISVNTAKHQMVLKQPTEVTLRMAVNDKTRVIGEDGKPMSVSELRSGDTAFISFSRSERGLTASQIRLGPMTWTVLQQRYLSGYSLDVPAPPLAPIVHPSEQPKQGSGRKQTSHTGHFPRHKPQSQT